MYSVRQTRWDISAGQHRTLGVATPNPQDRDKERLVVDTHLHA